MEGTDRPDVIRYLPPPPPACNFTFPVLAFCCVTDYHTYHYLILHVLPPSAITTTTTYTFICYLLHLPYFVTLPCIITFLPLFTFVGD